MFDRVFEFESLGVPTDGITKGKVQGANASKHHKGFEGCVRDHGPRFCELDKTNDRGEGSGFDCLNMKPTVGAMEIFMA